MWGCVGGLAMVGLTTVVHAADVETEPTEGAGGSSPTSETRVLKCGAPGQVPCPLQAWMRRKIAGPLASSDWAALARGLDESAAFVPDPSWTAWATYASAGANAARDEKLVDVRRACKQCHDAYRKEYRKLYRSRALPR